MRSAKIISTGMYAPERVITNKYFDDYYQKDIGSFLKSQRNIYERRWMNETQSTSDLALAAAKIALERAGLKANNIDLIIVATDTPDYLSPSTAAVVQFKLHATNAGTFDINTACAGFVTALDVACKYIQADKRYKNILVIGAYGMSKFLNMDDYKIASLFADGAGAVVIQAGDDSLGFQSSYLWTDGQYHDYMGIYAGGTWKPINTDVLHKKEHLLAFPKRIPPETNGQQWPRIAKETLGQIEKTARDVDHFLMTQFNIQSIHESLDRMEVPRTKAHYIMDRFGYTGSASIAMCLADCEQDKKLKKGDLILFIGSGGGMSMAGLSLIWAYNT